MPVLDRETLKKLFRNGRSPSESNFSDLIESTINKVDDGLKKNKNGGLLLSPQGDSKKLMSFFENINNLSPQWQLSINPDKKTQGLNFSGASGNSCLFLQEKTKKIEQEDGTIAKKIVSRIGIGTTEPNHALEVNGFIGMGGRIGTFKQGEVPADGKMHTILDNLDGCQMFEIVAFAGGKKGRGKYALMHAIAISTYGGGKNSIQKHQAHYDWFVNKLALKWKGNTHDYKLKIGTWWGYGNDETGTPYKIHYRITKLWDKSMLE